MTSPSSSPGIAWRALLLESLAVILSILLAFSIDAWWDGHKERGRERALLTGIMEDFQSSRPALQDRLLLARRMASSSARLLDLTAERRGSASVNVPDSLVIALLGAPTYEPAMDALDAALASGEIELIRNHRLRRALANWRRVLTDTSEDELQVRSVTTEQLVPVLAPTLDLHPYFEEVLHWSGGDPYGAGRLIAEGETLRLRGETALTVTAEISSLIAQRRFWLEFAAADLEDLLATLDTCLALLQEELDR